MQNEEYKKPIITLNDFGRLGLRKLKRYCWMKRTTSHRRLFRNSLHFRVVWLHNYYLLMAGLPVGIDVREGKIHWSDSVGVELLFQNLAGYTADRLHCTSR